MTEYEKDLEDDVVDISPYEGEPDYKTPLAVTEDGAQDDGTDPEDTDEEESADA